MKDRCERPPGFTGLLAAGTVTSKDLSGPMDGQTIAMLVSAMARGVTYVSLQTAGLPGGEIRGQLTEQEPGNRANSSRRKG